MSICRPLIWSRNVCFGAIFWSKRRSYWSYLCYSLAKKAYFNSKSTLKLKWSIVLFK
jgi:hypothetical protein